VLGHGLPGAAVAGVHADIQTHTHKDTHTHTCAHTCKHTHPSPPQAALCSATACPGQQWQAFMLMYTHTHTCAHTCKHNTPPHLRRGCARPRLARRNGGRCSCLYTNTHMRAHTHTHTHACTHASIHTPPHLRRRCARPRLARRSGGRRPCRQRRRSRQLL